MTFERIQKIEQIKKKNRSIKRRRQAQVKIYSQQEKLISKRKGRKEEKFSPPFSRMFDKI